MASNAESNVVKADEDENELVEKSQAETTEHEQGRIRRRGNVSANADKHNAGPVLRTTVKPVKRFRPDSSSDKTNPSPGRKKRLKSAYSSTSTACKLDECASTLSQAESKGKSNGNATPTFSPDGKGSMSSKDVDKNEKGHSSEAQVSDGNPPIKKKRVWEQWTVEDKNFFFEAVATYGKDFEAIRNAIAQKQRKRGEECTAKTKDQVRHLYYRTWTMISKIIDVDAYPPNINKAFQELYAVINYGELRKKLGGNLKKKGIEKLNELIREGSTSARFKGKNFRIKTPSCRALKKMHPEYQGKEGLQGMPLVSDTRRMKIPMNVTIELYPATMAAWNQVHSIAHNPRLKVRLSVDCQLSSLFTYLERKWKPLSGRIFCIANQSQPKNHGGLPKPVKSVTPSKWDGTLVIQTPPDASVNTRIMVFQVTNNKSHCVVSYALRKSVQATDKNLEKASPLKTQDKTEGNGNDENTDSAENSRNQETQNGSLSEPEAIDSSLSSEEDCDYDSATEDAVKEGSNLEQDSTSEARASPGECTSISLDGDGEVQTLNTSFVLKSKECSVPCSPVTDEPPTCTENDKMLQEHSNGEETIIYEENENKQKEVDNVVTSAKPIENMSSDASKCTAENMDIAGPSDTEPTDCISPKVSDEPPAIEKVSDDSVPDPKSYSDGDSCVDAAVEKDKKLLVSTKLFGKSTEKKKRKNSKRSKAFIKTVQSWNVDDCGKTTIAEVYMMLGKPSVFRLCYHWLQNAASQERKEAQSAEEIGNNEQPEKRVSLSSGLLALIQAAELTRRVGAVSIDSPDADEKTKQSHPKTQPTKTKSTATQCELIKQSAKADEKSGNTSSSSSTSSNPHGRGVSKLLPVETVLVNPANIPFAFAVPSTPTSRPRKIAANPNKPVQATMVSAETMNWLLQRERSRSRQIRRPIVLDRSSTTRSGRTNNRPMKTFSIVTKGPNKIGFMPSQPIQPATSSTRNTPVKNSAPAIQSTATSAAMPVTSQGTISIDDLLHMDSNTPGLSLVASDGNLLAQAAKEAGVAPPTPVKPISTEHPVTAEDSLDSGLNVKGPNNTGESDTVDTRNESGVHDSISTTPQTMDNGATQDLGVLQQDNCLPALPVGVSGGIIGAPQLGDLSIAVSTVPNSVECSISLVPPVSPSSLLADTTVVNSLPELSWPGHDISSSAFPIMNDNLIDKLVNGDADVVLSSFNSSVGKSNEKSSESGRLLVTPSPLPILDENSNGASRDNFYLPMTPVKSNNVPVHPWTINANSRDSTGLGSLLNTPQKIMPSDAEDSFDGLIQRTDWSMQKKVSDTAPCPIPNEVSFSAILDTSKSGSKSRPLDQNSSNFLSGSDPAVELQLQCLMNENSVDLVSKFQDLVRHTTEAEELTALASDENARDGHVAMDANFGTSSNSTKTVSRHKDNG